MLVSQINFTFTWSLLNAYCFIRSIITQLYFIMVCFEYVVSPYPIQPQLRFGVVYFEYVVFPYPIQSQIRYVFHRCLIILPLKRNKVRSGQKYCETDCQSAVKFQNKGKRQNAHESTLMWRKIGWYHKTGCNANNTFCQNVLATISYCILKES